MNSLNGRLYTQDMWEKAIKELNERIKRENRVKQRENKLKRIIYGNKSRNKYNYH